VIKFEKKKDMGKFCDEFKGTLYAKVGPQVWKQHKKEEEAVQV
jgi:hypothetical protein